MLTNKSIDTALKNRPQSGQSVLRDSEVKGLTLVIGAQRATWTLEAKSLGKRKKVVLGYSYTHSLDEARVEALKLKAQLAAATPAQVAETDRREKAAGVSNRERIKEHLDWLKSEGKGAKTLESAKGQVRLALQSIGMLDRTPSEVTEQHLRDIVAKAKIGSRVGRYGYTARYLKWCSSKGYLGNRKFRDIDLEDLEKPSQPAARERVLSLTEVRLVLKVLRESNTIDPVLRDLIRFLIFVPARKNEAAKARLRDVNVHSKYLEIAGKMSKNRQPHRFHLSPRALAIVERRMSKDQNALLFPSPRAGGVVMGWSKLKSAIDALLPDDFEPWVLHDLRRTFASHAADNKVDEVLIDLILNHKAARSRGGVTGVYIKARRWDERVAALDLWDKLIGGGEAV